MFGAATAADLPTMLYFAYGSNLNYAHFRALCPAAEPLGRALLPEHRLVFRRFADIEPAAGSSVHGALWCLTPRCEAALDHYEEVGKGLYRRVHLSLRRGADDFVEALSYRMSRTDFEPPAERYLGLIAAGYADFGIDSTSLRAAADGCGNQETPGLNATRPDA